ncbi:G5 domain-containing protein [Micromonospora sp. NPDC000089]|uniref:G5 domain-containing protein n=1 Tax=unclassified Micromonospora TaxID=2617518 RepID=UPI003674F7FF
MTTTPPPTPGAPYPPARRPGWFARLSPGRRVGVIIGGMLLSVLLLCCSGAAIIGAFVSDPQKDRRTVADDQSVPSAAAPVVVPSTGEAFASPTAAVASPTIGTSSPTLAALTPAPTTAAPVPTPRVEVRTETQRQTIRYTTRTVRDPNLAEGTRKVRTRGVDGVRSLTYQVKLTDGVRTGRTLVRSTITKQPVTQVVVVGTRHEPGCDPNYSGCVPVASDVDCAGGSGDGPAYVSGPIRVIGTDVYRLDHDHDSYACED